MKKFILFDNDGVLVETEMWYFEASKRALMEQFGITLGFDEYMEIMARGGTAWESAQRAGIDEERIAKARAIRNGYYQEYLRAEDIAIDGVHEVLAELSKFYRMGIVTTSRRVDFEIIHKGRGIVDFMEFVLCEEDYPRAKPHPDPYLAGLDRFGAKADEAIVVEDSQRGLSAAVAAGIECVVVHNEFTKSQDFSRATYKISKLDELKTVLNQD
jgi:HAD superfamily hydrolase (TIGR01509 family)